MTLATDNVLAPAKNENEAWWRRDNSLTALLIGLSPKSKTIEVMEPVYINRAGTCWIVGERFVHTERCNCDADYEADNGAV